jgi:hypothetical protein
VPDEIPWQPQGRVPAKIEDQCREVCLRQCLARLAPWMTSKKSVSYRIDRIARLDKCSCPPGATMVAMTAAAFASAFHGQRRRIATMRQPAAQVRPDSFEARPVAVWIANDRGIRRSNSSRLPIAWSITSSAP